LYGWSAAPGAVDTCVITSSGADFSVAVKADAATGAGTSTNGSSL
jgi:hypothetical protein